MTRKGEPTDFHNEVRTPGSTALPNIDFSKPRPFQGKEYWRRILPELHAAYNSICAYTAHWIPLDVGSDTVEHFLPKSIYPAEAYEWNNYRLVCARLNGRKGNHQDVVDPFLMPANMFQLDFPSLLIQPNPVLSDPDLALALSTRKRLKLNEERCVRSRTKYVVELRDHEITMGYLRRHAPFIHAEIQRQGIADQLDVIMADIIA